MTNGDYILKSLSFFGITQDTVEVIVADASLIAESPCDVLACKKAMLENEAAIRLHTKRSVSEGGFSLSWSGSDEDLDRFFKKLAKDVGEDETGTSRIRDISDKW